MDDHRSDPPLLRAADLGLEYLSSLQERAVGRPIEPEALRAAWVATMARTHVSAELQA